MSAKTLTDGKDQSEDNAPSILSLLIEPLAIGIYMFIALIIAIVFACINLNTTAWIGAPISIGVVAISRIIVAVVIGRPVTLDPFEFEFWKQNGRHIGLVRTILLGTWCPAVLVFCMSTILYNSKRNYLINGVHYETWKLVLPIVNDIEKVSSKQIVYFGTEAMTKDGKAVAANIVANLALSADTSTWSSDEEIQRKALSALDASFKSTVSKYDLSELLKGNDLVLEFNVGAQAAIVGTGAVWDGTINITGLSPVFKGEKRN